MWCSVRGYLIWRPQLVSCRLSQTRESQILERHAGMRSQRSSALHRASSAGRQSPFTASCRQESQVLERSATIMAQALCSLPHAGPELVWFLEFCSKLTRDPGVLQAMSMLHCVLG